MAVWRMSVTDSSHREYEPVNVVGRLLDALDEVIASHPGANVIQVVKQRLPLPIKGCDGSDGYGNDLREYLPDFDPTDATDATGALDNWLYQRVRPDDERSKKERTRCSRCSRKALVYQPSVSFRLGNWWYRYHFACLGIAITQ